MVSIEAMLSRAFVRFEPKGMGIRSVHLWTRTWLRNTGEKHPVQRTALNTKTAISRIRLIIENSPQPGPIEQLG